MFVKKISNAPTQVKLFSVSILATASFATESLADVGERYYQHGMSWGGGWFLGPVLMVLVFVIVVVAVAMSLRFFGNTAGQNPVDRAIEILNERFAKGEIDEAEFQKRKDALRK